MSLRFAPDPTAASSTHTLQGTHPEYAVHDSFRHGLHSVKHESKVHHPLQAPLAAADDLAFKRTLALSRSVYGLHAPLRLQMERSLVALKPMSPIFRSNNLGMEVLMGKDLTIDVEDILGDRDEMPDVNFHDAMERKFKISQL
ncbi:proteasome maturation factor UMP1-domain-containing protein [Blastocladiella britannica]|nr:proteasome maturation factor UMP1-domain-containing protein [Blastocladiella britannica]